MELHPNDRPISPTIGRLKKCEKWLEKCSLNDDESVISDSQCSVLTETTDNSAMDSGYKFQSDGLVLSDKVYREQYVDESLIFSCEHQKRYYENINIYKSKKVHIGDVTYINGPITMVNVERKRILIPSDDDFVVMNRTNWLAQPPLGEKQYLKEPAKYVIIGHTATEEGFTVAKNTLLVRLIQAFHIESRNWNDIAYNFLIGSDGLAYQGRGWGVIGAHTASFNDVSVGISFVGCFLDHLPPEPSLKKAKELIECGVRMGYIDPEYLLVGHCQCSATESPGKRLFEEIQTWKHWEASLTNVRPSLSKENRECQ